MDITKELRTISLCHGYGGIERGIELSGTRIKHLIISEIEAYSIANTIRRMEEGRMAPCPIFTDLKTLPVDCIPMGSVDLITGGYPCQPFSGAGKRLGEEDPRHLWPYVLRIIDSCMPRMCFFENVEGHITKGLQTVLCDLESRGYKTTWGIFSAAEVGAPHQRKRVFILAKLANSESRSNGQQPSEWEGREMPGGRSEEELGNTQHDGSHGSAVCGSNEATDNQRRTEEPGTPGELEGASGLYNGESRGRGESGGKQLLDRGVESSGTIDELADSKNLGCGGRSDKDRDDGRGIQESSSQERSMVRGETEGCGGDSRGEELADTQHKRPVQQQPTARLREGLSEDGGNSCRGGDESLADPIDERSQGGQNTGWEDQHGHLGCSYASSLPRWPARPGEEQHGWEEPRTIEPGMGGTANGTPHRIDQLRMLGNGVVPQTAAKAWITLNKELNV